MASSDRRIAANRINAKLSTGPRTEEGKEVSRANASKLGMTAVVVVPGEEAGEADRRTERLQGQLAPGGDEMGLILARHAALSTCSSTRSRISATTSKSARPGPGPMPTPSTTSPAAATPCR